MTTAPHDRDSTVKSLSAIGDAPSVLRLQLASAAPPEALVNGGWWPQSTDLAAELPALLTALHPQLGQVALVGYHLSAWEPTESHIDVNGREVLLQGFTSEGPHTVLVIGTSGRRLALLVVPPDTLETTAQRGMAEAAHRMTELAAPANGNASEAAADSLQELIERLERIGRARGDYAASIEQLVHEAARQFDGAPIQIYVPILVEHIVRQQIRRWD